MDCHAFETHARADSVKVIQKGSAGATTKLMHFFAVIPLIYEPPSKFNSNT